MMGRLVLKKVKDVARGKLSQPVEAAQNSILFETKGSASSDYSRAFLNEYRKRLRNGNALIKRNGKLERKFQCESLSEVRSRLRGTVSAAQVHQNTFRIFSPQSKVFQCDFFRLLYFPPEHFVALLRKSKPAVNVRVVGEVFLNGNVARENGEHVKYTEVFAENSRQDGYGKAQDFNKTRDMRSLFGRAGPSVPRNYAFLRRELRVFVGGCMTERWLELQGDKAVADQIRIQEGKGPASSTLLDDKQRPRVGVAKDGFYLFQVLIFPDKFTKPEFRRCVRDSITKVADLDWDKFLQGNKSGAKTWVEEANARVRLPVLNKLLESDQVARILKKT
ncbi:LAMI_0F09208g1_1 [Lachancea mirantina]|uniref:LAMI_0F09208g1_1 n=1 Tax=Lachancea mirantina TaxID=1230905 RepID=A0A1G4K112_9SACH|nr:LAMI_0F09208g1_1 [Lachancea mirantina]